MNDQPSLQSFFAEALHTQAHLSQVNQLEDSLIGLGDFLNEWDHSADAAVEHVRTALRTVRINLKFLLATSRGNAESSDLYDSTWTPAVARFVLEN